MTCWRVKEQISFKKCFILLSTESLSSFCLSTNFEVKTQEIIILSVLSRKMDLSPKRRI